MGHNGDRGLFSHLGQLGLNNMFTTQLFGKNSGRYGARNSQAAENSPHGYPSGHVGHASSGFLAGGGAAYGAHHVSNGYGSHDDGSHGYASHGQVSHGHGGYGHGGYGQHHGHGGHAGTESLAAGGATYSAYDASNGHGSHALTMHLMAMDHTVMDPMLMYPMAMEAMGNTMASSIMESLASVEASGRYIKEKNQVLAKDASKVVGLSYGVEEPVLSSLGGHTVEKVIENNDVTGEPSRESVNFHTLIASARNGADVAILLESVGDISACFANIVYGFFMGKYMAFFVVDNYVINTWSKYGPVKSMLNSYNGLFFLKFSSKDRKDAMLENDPTFIRNNPFILNKWNPDLDELSVIATKLGSPLMLDSYTSDMCMQSWGRSSYVRAMIEFRVDVVLKDTIVVAMPRLVGEGFYVCTIRVEYQWKLLRCSGCNVFGHVLDECPTKIVSDVVKNLNKPRQAARGVQVGPNWAPRTSISTPIAEQIDKLQRKNLDLKLMFVDDDGKPLYKVDSIGIADRDSKVEEVFNETTCYMSSTS
uniref:DUF4283 domain-containing protein n=1 Tax=Tanacetum cinerariifolium TaxID=118510 RepID=A0A6L2J5W4_TANCI|nr:hypothetical protein [Tanacetum cinerariifolium]